MFDAASEAIGFARGRRRRDLDRNTMLLLSLVKAVDIVGEAASQVSAGTRKTLPGIPWPAIVAMRHRLVHAYYDINQETVWRTVKEDLPPLVKQLESALKATV
jgi:uncharacterized protein with HEPN domain